ncbi:Scr1 family TA system antitoxin-like transcriptional regulator [Streptomyces sp. NPDC057702]|uniref:Scr1 family TA system antitoxin-like transcriptional regulator n=1 Tax=unclassified Streptomyces TaxID=2593676 RepID=UPI0036893DA0
MAGELKGRLAGLETTYRSWRRQLADGFRPRQDVAIAETEATRAIRALEVALAPGLAQTADYARHVFAAAATFRRVPRDAEDAIRTRMRHQQVLYEPGRSFRFLIWEGALFARPCPPPPRCWPTICDGPVFADEATWVPDPESGTRRVHGRAPHPSGLHRPPKEREPNAPCLGSRYRQRS